MNDDSDPVLYYQKMQKAIKSKIEKINKLLAGHELEFSDDPTSWGYPYDLAHVNMSLDDIISFLCDSD